jgi:hypothetical protein
MPRRLPHCDFCANATAAATAANLAAAAGTAGGGGSRGDSPGDSPGGSLLTDFDEFGLSGLRSPSNCRRMMSGCVGFSESAFSDAWPGRSPPVSLCRVM